MKKITTLLFYISSVVLANDACKVNSNELLINLISNHPTIKMSQDIIKASKQRTESAYWGFFPTPSVNISAKNSDRYNTVASLDQPIWTGGKLSSKYDMVKSQEDESLNLLKENSLNLIENYFSIIETYSNAKANIIELNEGLENLLELKKMLKRRINSGVSSSSDSELLDSRIEQIKSNLLLEKNRYKTAILQLELILDKKLSCEVYVDEKQNFVINNLDESIDRLLSFHPTLSKLDSEIVTAKHQLKNTKASAMPNLSLRAEHRRGDLYGTNNDNTKQNLAYLAFSVTTNAGLSILSDIEEARIQISQLKFRKLSIEKELIDSFLSDYNNYLVSKKRINSLKNSVESSKKVLKSYKRLFVAGKKQWLNLVDSSRELMNYKINLANSKTSKNILAYKIALKNGQIDLLSGEFR